MQGMANENMKANEDPMVKRGDFFFSQLSFYLKVPRPDSHY